MFQIHKVQKQLKNLDKNSKYHSSEEKFFELHKKFHNNYYKMKIIDETFEVLC